jgi:hypothetical protein
MARKTPSRLELRKQAEAAEAAEAEEGASPKKKKKATKKKATRKKRVKEKVADRRRLIWGIFNGSMKEEARFPYEERAEAEEKMKALRKKSTKKMFFIQPIKEIIPLSELKEKVAAEEEEE